jgi:putative DNA primase/helicase
MVSMTAYERLIDAAGSRGYIVKETGPRKAKQQCGHHNDSNPSVSVTGIETQALIHCHAGCDTADVLAAYGLTMADLFDDRNGATYQYPDDRRVHRKLSKDFPQSGNTKGNALFHANLIGDAITVYVVEGEKDVLAIEAVAGVAVCSAMGAGNGHLFDWSPLKGKTAIIIADKDKAGRDHARKVAELLRGIAESVRIVEAAVGKDAADHIAADKTLDELVDVQPPSIGSDLKIVTLADVEPERVQWLWPGRIPVGKLVILDGDPGVGKSTVAIDVSATVTTGGSWPDGSVCTHPGAVLIMSAEDGLADTIRPRCDAAGADVANVHAIEGVPIISEDGEVTLRPPTLADVIALENTVKRTGARLLVIDVIMAYLPAGRDSHKDQDIRAVLSRLSALADRTGCSVLLLRHLNKTGGRDPLYRGGGSIGIVGAARAGMLVAVDPDDPERRVLASVKSNLGPAPDSLAYRLVESGDHGVARVQWEGVTTHTARTLLDPPDRDDDEFDDRDYTEYFRSSWLYQYLSDAHEARVAIRPKDAVAVGADKGHSRRSVFRLFSSLANTGMVESVDEKEFPQVTHWRLITADTAGDSPHDSQTGGTTGTTGADLQKQVGTTGELFDPGGTTGEIAADQVKRGDDSPVVPVVPPNPRSNRGQPLPAGSVTALTPGFTDRVKAALAKAGNGSGDAR